MIDWIDVAGGVLEMIEVMIIAVNLSDDNNRDIKREGIAIVLASTLIPLLNSFNIPYHAVVTVLGAALILFVVVKKELVSAITDSIFGFVWGFLYQAVCLGIMLGVSQIVRFKEIVVRFILLVLMDILAFLFIRNEAVQEALFRFYYGNRKAVLWIAVTITILCSIVINLWAPDDTAYSNKRLEIIILIVLYVVINTFFIYGLLKRKKAEEELYEAHEYEDYLHELMDQMKSREHEYKNHIQHIVSITEAEDVKDKDKRIHEYTRQILNQADGPTQSAVTDNIAVSIFLHQVKKRAEEEHVNLEYYIEKPFPEYKIPEKDLVELISNAINNAFEAVAGLEPEKRSIFILFQDKHIEVINTMPYSGKINTSVSTKGSSRGYGRKNMLRIAKKYDIKLETEVEEDRFVVSIDF